MSDILKKIQKLAAQGSLRISEHGYDELSNDGLLASEVLAGIEQAVAIEDYPTYSKGPCVLVLQRDDAGLPIHVVWGIPIGKNEPAVLVTAYRPDQRLWDATYLRRR
ncbi:MAG: DUF4258 domain-containing protein [Tepidisphaeraceae bacterium]